MIMKIRCILIISVWLSFTFAAQLWAAQQQDEIHFEHVLNLATHISDFLQDEEGFFWFSSTSGLIRYDGLEVTIYKKRPHSVSSDVTNALAETDDALWILTGFQGLNRMNKETGTFTYYQHNPDDPASLNDSGGESLFVDSSGILWIGTREGGLNKFNRDAETFTHYPHDPNDPHSLSDNYVTDIFEDRAGMLWIGTQHGGLNSFDRDTETFTRYPSGPDGLSGQAVNVIYEDASGALWVGTGDGGLNKFNRQTGVFTVYRHDPNDPTSVSLDTITDIYEDETGILWIGTFTGGLNRFDPATNTFSRYVSDPENPGSLSSDSPLRIHLDRSNILWIISKDGKLDKYDKKRKGFILYQHDPQDPTSLSDNVVLPIYEDRQGTIWIGTGGGGLNKFDKTQETFLHYQPNPENPDDPESLPYMTVTAILEDDLGNFWIDSTNDTEGVLSLFDRESGKFLKHYRHDPHDPRSIPQNKWLTRIFQDRHAPHILWLTIAKEGLIKFDTEQESFTHYAPNPNDPDALLGFYNSMMRQDDDGTLWLGGVHGLDHFDPQTATARHYQHDPDDPASISDNTTLAILEDRSGTLWFGTAGGLNKFDRAAETFTHYTTDDGLPDNHIYAIFEDTAGDLWMSTNGGIARFTPATETFRTYTQRDGLQGDAFYYWAYCQTRDGEIWFGGLNGVNRFRPENIQDNPYLPNMVLTSVTQGGEAIDSGKSPIRLRTLRLDWQANFFEFDFAGLEYTNPEKNRYAYILEGFDKDWYYSGTIRKGRYSNLPGGTYTLRLKGSNNDGLWSEQERIVRIVVASPPWKTWWAYSLYVLIPTAILFGYIRFQRKKLARERVINARLRQVDKLKDEFLANTSHELRTPLSGIIGLSEAMLSGVDGLLTEQANRHMQMILQSSKRLTNLVNTLLDFSKVKAEKLHLNLKSFHLAEVVEIVTVFSQEILKTKPVRLITDIPANLPQMYADMEKVEQILTNVVGNAIKFTRQGFVRISARQEGDFVRVSVHDTGIGIPPEFLDSIFTPFEQGDGSITREFGGTGLGLAIAKELVELHGGQIWIESEVGRGSCVHFTLSCLTDSLAVQVKQETPLLPVSDIPKHQHQFEERRTSPDTVTTHDEIYDDKKAEYLAIRKGNGETILVVDDEPVNIEVFRTQLEQYNYQVLTALNGFEALEKIEASLPDLVLLDLMMPKMSGFRLCQILREERQFWDLPIILLTARSHIYDKVYGLNVGANDYIVKPFHKDELLTRIHVLLRISSLQKEQKQAEKEIRQLNAELEQRVRQRTAELGAANKELKDFAYIVSHDLKAPLRGISQIAQWLVMDYADAFDDEGKEMAQRMINRVKRLDKLIDGILQYSRVGRVIETDEEIALQTLVSDVIDLLAPPETIQITINTELPVIVGDKTRITQVFQNLLSNAVNFIDKTNGYVVIDCVDEGRFWKFSISDNGAGIDPKYHDKIFQIFQTLASRDERESTGIGLAIVKKIVELYGGKIWVESTPGQGSTFSFTLPRVQNITIRHYRE